VLLSEAVYMWIFVGSETAAMPHHIT